MLTKFILYINDTEYELQSDDLENWAEILCTFKRNDYGGVIRSCSSKFNFVNKARKFILEAYLSDGLNVGGSIKILTKNNSLGYDERFDCPLDFSTIEWNSYSLSINCVDNSLAALIKANKSTKYEFGVDTEILRDGTLNFDRIPMVETATYAFTQGTSLNDSAEMMVRFKRNELPWVGNIGSEVTINEIIEWKDDQDNSDPSSNFLLKAYKDVKVSVEFEVSYRDDHTSANTPATVGLGVLIRRSGSYLQPNSDGTTDNGYWFTWVSDGLYHKITNSNGADFVNPGQLPDPSTIQNCEKGYAVIYGFVWELKYNGSGYQWEYSGKTPEQFFTVRRTGKFTLSLKDGDCVVLDNSISGIDTVVVRMLSSKFIFGWEGIGDKESIPVMTPKNVAETLLKRISGRDVAVEISNHDQRIANTYLMAAESARGIIGAKFYSSFNEYCDWMSAVFGYVYRISDDGQTVTFLHRSEVFDAEADVEYFSNCRDLRYSVESSVIYSAVTAGYDKKDYGNINGRVEFNFSNTYSTGCNVTDKTLSLLSKYRADSYGIEFAVQMRGKDTTDSKEDKDVFFILCKNESGNLVPDRDIEIANSLTSSVFNGAFTPMSCIRANAGFIGLMAEQMTLTFASSTGNSDIIVAGEPMTADIEIDTPIATCGVVEFTTDEIFDVQSPDNIISIADGGITYKGYLRDVDIRYSREQACKYKMIVKEVMS